MAETKFFFPRNHEIPHPYEFGPVVFFGLSTAQTYLYCTFPYDDEPVGSVYTSCSIRVRLMYYTKP